MLDVFIRKHVNLYLLLPLWIEFTNYVRVIKEKFKSRSRKSSPELNDTYISCATFNLFNATCSIKNDPFIDPRSAREATVIHGGHLFHLKFESDSNCGIMRATCLRNSLQKVTIRIRHDSVRFGFDTKIHYILFVD